MSKVKKFYNGISFEPLSADPGSPVEGQIQFSDGTARPKGLWQYKDGAWAEIGGGVGGGLDVFFTEDHETNGVSNYTSGNNATFDNGGTLDGTLALDTSTQLAGDQGFKYTMGSASTNDWIKSEAITVGEKEQDNVIAFEFHYKYDGDDDDIRFVIYDNTNSEELTLSTVYLKQSTSSKRFQAQAYIPDGVTSIGCGFQVVTGNNTKILLVDDIVGTSNPFVSKDIFNISGPTSYTPTFQGFGTPTGVEMNYMQVGKYILLQGQFNPGSTTAVEAQMSLPSGMTVASDVSVTVVGRGTRDRGFANSNKDLSIIATGGDTFINFGLVHYISAVIPTAPQTASSLVGSGQLVTVNAWIKIEELTTQEESLISYAPSNRSNSMVRLNTGNGHGSTNTKIRRFSTTITNTGNAITYADSATDGASFTINEAGIYYISYSDEHTSSSVEFGLSLNSSQLTTDIISITDNDRLASSTNVSAAVGNCAWMGVLNVDDVIRPHTRGSHNGTGGEEQFTITKVGVEELLGVPKPIVGYLRDEKSAGTAGGTFTSGAWQTRDLNVTDGDFTKFGSLSSNQFTLQPGVYHVEAKAIAKRCNGHKTKIYNTTDATDVVVGLVTYSGSTDATISHSVVEGVIEITSAKTFELQHRCESTQATDGFGDALSVGVVEVYSTLKLTKLI